MIMRSGELDSTFEFGLDFGELRASTPTVEQQIQGACASVTAGQRAIVKGENYVVLRIGSVPWVKTSCCFFFLFTDKNDFSIGYYSNSNH